MTLQSDTRDGPFSRSPFLPTQLEILIGGLIWRHRGRQDPISIAEIQRLTDCSPRTIKGIVEALVVSHRMRIGAARGERPGYYIIVDIEDQAAAVKSYRSQIISMLNRLRVLDSPESIREFLGQLELEAHRG
jgi:hypothetical protein